MLFQSVRRLMAQAAAEPTQLDLTALSVALTSLQGRNGPTLAEPRYEGVGVQALMNMLGRDWRFLAKIPHSRQTSAMVDCAMRANAGSVEFAAPRLLTRSHVRQVARELTPDKSMRILQAKVPADWLDRSFYLHTLCAAHPAALKHVPAHILDEAFLAAHLVHLERAGGQEGPVATAQETGTPARGLLRLAVMHIPMALPILAKYAPATLNEILADRQVALAAAAQCDFDALPASLQGQDLFQWKAASENPRADSFASLRPEYLLLAAAARCSGDPVAAMTAPLTRRAAAVLFVSEAQATQMVLALHREASDVPGLFDPEFDERGLAIEPPAARPQTERC